MRKLFSLVIIFNFLLIFLPGDSNCRAASSQYELEWDYLSSHVDDRNLDTQSLHILKKFSENKNKSMYRGITITRSRGDIYWENENKQTSAFGIGPLYMLRYEKNSSKKLLAALDISGGFIVYNKRFPAGGEYYNFMWRVGPRLIYKINDSSFVNIGYMWMHVSNGLDSNNPGDDARGFSLGFVKKF